MRKNREIINQLFDSWFGPGFAEAAHARGSLFSSWNQVMAEIWPTRAEDRKQGDLPAAAGHSRIGELDKGILQIETDHPGWIQILQTKQDQILEILQKRNPKLEIRGITFRLARQPFSVQAPGGAPRSEPTPKPQEPTLSGETPSPKETFSAGPTPSDRTPSPEEPFPPSPTRARSSSPMDEDLRRALASLEKTMKERGEKGNN